MRGTFIYPSSDERLSAAYAHGFPVWDERGIADAMPRAD